MTRVTLGATVRLCEWDLDDDAAARLRSDLTLPNPAHVQMVKAGFRIRDIEPTICAAHTDGIDLVLPRGALAMVPGDVEVVDQTTTGESIGRTRKPELRDYQIAAMADMLLDHCDGVLHGCCGSGKTVTGLAMIATLDRTALVLAHTTDLVNQWVDQAAHFLGVECGVIGAGSRTEGPITVATMQTLALMDATELAELGSRYGVVIVDECHHIPSASYQKIMAHMPARWRYGLTATPTRSDGLAPMIEWTMGPVRHRIHQTGLVEAGHLITAEIIQADTGWTPDYPAIIATYQVRKGIEQPDTSLEEIVRRYSWEEREDPNEREPMPGWLFALLVGALCDDRARNRLIMDIAQREARAGHSVIILSQRVEHCRLLASALVARGVKARALVAKVGKKRRAAIIEETRAGELDVVIATQPADEGLDIPRLECGILATPTRSKERTEQRLGRLLRSFGEQTKARLHDLVDGDVGQLANQWRSRRAAYRQALGSDVVIRRWRG